jgi:hypothetical protein
MTSHLISYEIDSEIIIIDHKIIHPDRPVGFMNERSLKWNKIKVNELFTAINVINQESELDITTTKYEIIKTLKLFFHRDARTRVRTQVR